MRHKVLFIIDRMNIGGAPSVVMEHLRLIDRSAFEPWLITLYGSKQGNFLGEARGLIGTEHVVEFRLWRRNPLDIVTLWRIYRFLRRERFDAVVTHLFLGNLLGRALALLAGVPRIISFEHSRYTGKRGWQIFADRLLSKKTYRIVVSNEEIRDFTAAQEGISLEKFAVIPNPIPPLPKKDEHLLMALRKEWGVPEGKIVFLALGRFSEEKGHEILIRAAALAAARAPDIFVLILGHGALKKILQELVSRLGIGEQCRVIVDPLRARNAYYLADVFVLPSLREGSSIATAEAQFTGLPVVASDLPTLRTLVHQDVSGILVPAGDSNALADAMVRLAGDDSLRKRIAEEARKSSLGFNSASAMKAFEALLI